MRTSTLVLSVSTSLRGGIVALQSSILTHVALITKAYVIVAYKKVPSIIVIRLSTIKEGILPEARKAIVATYQHKDLAPNSNEVAVLIASRIV